jgi:hypothetical protein
VLGLQDVWMEFGRSFKGLAIVTVIGRLDVHEWKICVPCNDRHEHMS